jgi:hypothetical protein
MIYHQLHDNDWVRPIKKGYRIKCCSCGLVHVLDFKTIKHGKGISVMFRARRDLRATRRARKKQSGKG